jgi:hypothetical protein
MSNDNPPAVLLRLVLWAGVARSTVRRPRANYEMQRTRDEAPAGNGLQIHRGIAEPQPHSGRARSSRVSDRSRPRIARQS